MKIEFFEKIKERDLAAKSYFEILFCYPGVQAVLLHRVSHFLYLKKIPFLPRFLAHLGRVFTGVEIHPGAVIGRNLFIDHGMGVVIGQTAVVGDDVLIYHGVTLGSRSMKGGRRHPKVGNSVVIGAGAKVIGGVEIGDRARIGANAVVVGDVGQGEVVVGAVAKRLVREVDYVI